MAEENGARIFSLGKPPNQEDPMPSPARLLSLLLPLWLGCAAPVVEPASPTPTHFPRDAQGRALGPNGGRLERVGAYYIETVLLPNGASARYAYDQTGTAVPLYEAEAAREESHSLPGFDPFGWW